ncbi:hypothetical protein SK128_021589 [Halocaridina rubra]|uniref:Carboxylesterase type B domain-containing protein n=1 Tax=Halocaridina rubra TaxID=373956 RepID=A0AAN8X9N4_HALRR
MYLAYLVPHGYLNDTEYIQNQMMNDLLNCFGVEDQTNGIGESLVDAYVGELKTFDEAAPGFVDLAGVLFLKAGGWKTAKMHAKYMTTPAYFYSFDFLSDDTMFRWLFMGVEGLPFEPGVTHADELMYLFSFPAVMEGQQIVVMDRMTTLWTNFARYRDPTPDAEDNWKKLGIPKWERMREDKHHYMLIQDECHALEEYPERWHVTWEETINPPTTTETPVTGTKGPSPEDMDELEKERKAFMISMIVFVVTTVLLALGCAIMFFKSR